MDNVGRCITCGFLAKHVQNQVVPPPWYFEMDEHSRSSGKAFEVAVLQTRFPCTPACFRHVPGVQAECSTLRAMPDKFKEVINTDRKCSKWYQYIPGLSPQEHFQEMKQRELESRRQEFEQGIENARREFDLYLFTKGKELSEQNEASNRRVNMVLIFFALVQIVLAAFQIQDVPAWMKNLLPRIPFLF